MCPRSFCLAVQSQASMGNCSVGREMWFLVEMLLLEEFIQMFSEGEIRGRQQHFAG